MPHEPRAAKLLLALAALVALVALLAPAPLAANYPIFSQRYAADPSPLVVGGRVYVFASHDLDGQTGWDMRDFTCISSDDLVNWTDHGEIFDAPRDTTWAANAWAPAVVAQAGRFFLYYSNARNGTGVAVADSILGPWSDPLGAPLVTTGNYSDPAVLADDDGTIYLHTKDALWGRLNPDMTSLAAPLQTFPSSSFPDYKEGGIIHKIAGRYNLSYSTPPLPGYGWTYAQSVSDAPDRGFVSAGKWFWLSSDNEPNTHGDFFSFAGRWFMVYHNHAVAIGRSVSSIYQRSLAIDRIYLGTDGTIRYLTSTRGGMAPVKYLDPYARIEAETMAAEYGIETEPCTQGGRNVGQIADGDWIRVDSVDFGAGATRLLAAVASGAAGGAIELRLDTTGGRLVGRADVPPTGGWQSWTTVGTTVAGASGIHDLYFVFRGGNGALFNFDWWQFEGGPPAGRTPPATRTSLVCLKPHGRPGAGETYLRVDNEDGTYSLRQIPGRRYLTLLDPVAGTIGLGDRNDPATHLVLVSNPDRTFCLRAANDKFIVADALGALFATHDESTQGSPRLLPGGEALFDLEECASDSLPACDVHAVDAPADRSLPLRTVYGNSCGRVDATIRQGRVALPRPDAAPGAGIDGLAPAAGSGITFYQLGCGCSTILRLRKDSASQTVVLE